MAVKTDLLIVAGVGLGIYLIALKVGESVGETVDDSIDLINPANPTNLINSAFNNTYQFLTGSPDTLGGDVFDGVQNVKEFFW